MLSFTDGIIALIEVSGRKWRWKLLVKGLESPIKKFEV